MKIGSLFLLLIAGFIPLHAQDSGAIPAGAPKGWPRSFTNNGTAFTVYQPQAISWSNGILTFRAAASVLPEGTAQPTFGTVTLCGMTAVDNEQQTVALRRRIRQETMEFRSRTRPRAGVQTSRCKQSTQV